MNYHEYIQQKKEFYNIFLEYLENDEMNEESENFDIIKKSVESFQTNCEEFKLFFQILIKIANDHHRIASLDNKVKQIIQFFSNEIKQILTNSEILEMSKANKRILLFLIQNEILTIDKLTLNFLLSNTSYRHFFYPEIKTKIDEEKNKKIEEELLSINSNIFDNFDKKREIGENDSYVATLIRNDSIDEFIIFVNQTNFSVSSQIQTSIFETNTFLIDKKPILIEYASFFGSIRIFKYLQNKKIQLNPNICIYSIHSNNPELISILEENIEVDVLNNDCLFESIKCHHNEIAIYIESNLPNLDNDRIAEASILSCNFSYFPDELNEKHLFNLFKLNYITILNIYFENNKNEIERKLMKKDTFEGVINSAASQNQIEIICYLLMKKNVIENNFFNQNDKLESLVIPMSILSFQNGAFMNCRSLTKVLIPSSIKKISNFAFNGCLQLKEITIPSSVVSIGDFAFSNCSSLQEITIPSSVNSIGYNCFVECTSLRRIDIPYSLVKIGDGAFEKCNFKQVTIPSSIDLYRTGLELKTKVIKYL